MNLDIYLYGFSEVWGGGPVLNPVTLLPLTLVEQGANCYGNYIEMTWATGSETDNDYFIIERSANGVDYFPQGIVQGAGNSSQIVKYLFIDNNPLKGTSYYRLKMVDYNGIAEYGMPVKVTCGESTPDFGNLVIYSEPGSNDLIISFDGVVGQTYHIGLYDGAGRLMDKRKIIYNYEETIRISKAGLRKGIYYVKLQSDNEVITKEVLIH